ncbi:MAG: DUF1016 N-terminal domain-containing protein [Sulfuricurvum sp.]|jgi:hypothetical protein|uniref:DUF1016 N-terminal domain-containing protein n=1 Tax=Sulfuricurvum sp. TaxID=2025608 RepID=UPI0025E83432|nr:DUF1016 N-terminal domain-containing protein [Sulfuricurvum sp.]MCK9373221.1 DUF1016 N-terminal domain-containing protein [Sulfuricurvum sp.]
MSNIDKLNHFYEEIKTLLHQARTHVYSTINTTMTQTYWQIGKRIVEEEQHGESRATYGKAILKNLSDELVREFGKGFSEDNLKNMRRFYLAFQKSETVSHKFKLSWSHYIFLTRIDNIDERNFYEIEAVGNSWTLREMKRQFDSGLYERLKLSLDKSKELSIIKNNCAKAFRRRQLRETELTDLTHFTLTGTSRGVNLPYPKDTGSFRGVQGTSVPATFWASPGKCVTSVN